LAGQPRRSANKLKIFSVSFAGVLLNRNLVSPVKGALSSTPQMEAAVWFSGEQKAREGKFNIYVI
jgi:hypothetical protein